MEAANTLSLRHALLELGFDVVRLARVDGEAPGAAALDARINAGMLADMDWLARNADKRRDPQLVLPGARTMIALGVNYGLEGRAMGDGRWAIGKSGKAMQVDTAVWARYSLYQDYHDTMKPALIAAGKILEEKLGIGGGDYRYYVDTGPVLERGWASKAGLGFMGKNAMLISREFGNWLFLSTILVRAEIEADAPLGGEGDADQPAKPRSYCGRCTRCMDACPTKALPEPGVLDARLCISYQTIENKGSIPVELRPAIGNRIYGCDICAEVCPWNRFAQDSRSLLLKPRLEIAELELRDLLHLTPERFAAVFKGTPIKRLKLAGLLRNACVVAGNSGDKSLLPELTALTQHESALVREHALWAVERLDVGP